MDGKRRRGRQAREKIESGRSTGREPHGDRYGQLADWIGVSATGSGHADEVVVGIVGIRALGWWMARLGQVVSRRRPRPR
jgi:hypothetical protein